MDNVTMQRVIPISDLIGRTKRPDYAMEKLVKFNAMNRTGNIDYNKYGEKTNRNKLDPVLPDSANWSGIFVDNFLLQTLVANYQIVEKKYIHCGIISRKIYSSCGMNGLNPVSVKAVKLAPIACHSSERKESLLSCIQDRDIMKEAELKANGTPITLYWQEYKVSCADVNYSDVLSYIRSRAYVAQSLFLKDIDFTIDLKGSFNKEEVIQHMLNNSGFRMQSSDDNGPRTILDNDHFVGKNCLTFMEDVGGFSTRAKLYNKHVQMLECKGVREHVGQHWKDWAAQNNTRLAAARDASTESGLTRAEVTFYVYQGVPKLEQAPKIPSAEEIATTLQRLISYVPSSLVYTTPHAATWKSHCDAMKHSLIVVDKDTNGAIVVYTYNEVTGCISGVEVGDWENNRMWCMTSLTLGEKLPIDLIQISRNNDESTFTVTNDRYFKVPKEGVQQVMTTRLVNKRGVFGHFCHNNTADMNARKLHNAHLLDKSGFIATEQCTPLLACVKGNIANKVGVDLIHMGSIEVSVEPMSAQSYDNKQERFDSYLYKCFMEMQEKSEQISKRNKVLAVMQEAIKCHKNELGKLPIGAYKVMAIKEWSHRTIMLLDVNGEFIPYVPNKSNLLTIMDLLRTMPREQKENLQHGKFKFLTLVDRPLAELVIQNYSWSKTRHLVVHSSITFVPELQPTQESNMCNAAQEHETDPYDLVPTLNPLECTHYQTLPNLAKLPENSIHVLVSKCKVVWRNNQKLVVKLGDGVVYQAGKYLQENEDKLSKDCRIKIGKKRVERSSRNLYALCTIAAKDDWATLLPFKELPELGFNDNRETVHVKEVATVEEKGRKRKLIMADDNVVYRLKKVKKAENIVPGMAI